jgi:glycosyltransferase involved in cell wall biosynthesis
MDRVVDKYPMARHGLVLFGHRPHRDVARLLAGVRNGLAPEVAPRGIYVCASEKEEFGLAILEAMATGLTVVGPSCGGPATYITDGENGFLARTTSVSELRHTIHRAARARLDDVISLRGQRLVRTRFTIGAMAKALVRMYQGRSTLTESANAA